MRLITTFQHLSHSPYYLDRGQDIGLTNPAGLWAVGSWQNLTFNLNVLVVVPANVERILTTEAIGLKVIGQGIVFVI